MLLENTLVPGILYLSLEKGEYVHQYLTATVLTRMT